MKKVLIIDKNIDICNMLSTFLTKKGYEVEVAHNGLNGLRKLKDNEINIVLTEIRLTDFPGVEIIKEIKKIRNRSQVIIVTTYSDVKIAVKAMKSGAHEYVTKPILPEEIILSIKSAEEKLNQTTTEKNKKPVASKIGSNNNKYVKGSGAQAEKINRLIKLVGPTDMSTILMGESGTGKEVVAQQIHFASKRKNNPFIAVDCGALPDELAGSELFGFVKGAFTGAIADKAGYFEQAKGGTLFLDEIGNLSYENQVKLLRVLQEKKVRRIGGLKDVKVNVRIIAATNEDLKEKVENHEFREDIYFRINEFKIELPALRERGADIDLFLEHFLAESNAELNKKLEGYEPDVIAKMKSYPWYGNIRELKNVIKRATLLEQGKRISMQSIPEEIIYPVLNESPHPIIEKELVSLKEIVEETEKKAILRALKQTNFNKTKCADLLKVDRKTLYNKMNQYEIEI